MAEILHIITKNDNTNWIKIDANTINTYTAEEIEILTNSRTAMENLPGFLHAKVKEISSNTMHRIFYFDTMENANSALSVMWSEDPDSIFFKRKQILTKKLSEIDQAHEYEVIVKP